MNICLLLLLSSILKVSTNGVRQGKKNKGHQDWKGRRKTVFVLRLNDHLYRKCNGIYRKLLEVISEFSGLQDTRIIYKSFLF